MSSSCEDPFGLLSPSMWQDPYPTYARLRSEAPVYYVEPWRTWFVTRYADVSAAFRDPRLTSARGPKFERRFPSPLGENLSRWTTFIDPPEHTPIRKRISKAFTPRVVERLRPAISELVTVLLNDALHGEREGTLDLVAALAAPLPVAVIGDLFGIPRSDRNLLKAWSDALAVFFANVRPTDEATEKARIAVGELEAYLRESIAARRRSPKDDLLSSLVAQEDELPPLDERELLSTCTTILFGGHETTSNLIATGMLNLLRHPDQLACLRARPEVMPSAVEELLRFDPPAQYVGRMTKDDLRLGDQAIPSGSQVFLVAAAANRDPDAFAEPDRLDVLRVDNRHLSFGHGIHYCIGAALARAEACAALHELLSRFRTIELVDCEPAWTKNLSMRGLESLVVRTAGSGTTSPLPIRAHFGG